jgi:maltose alpha-D-glucosyltransferase / alpha-amylase
MSKPGSARDHLWYKDAIIYELHVRSFYDSNGDGVGDLQGLTQKLDYIQDLGVTCIWLLPFFPSPLRDDGYDISDYTGVHPMYGTIEDFRAFLDAAHERGLQVLIELVMNHTSDEHPWFQRARHAPAGSPERDFYVWSNTDQKYPEARIIFTDTEKSNWTWDPVAQAYYWHRFFSHQPDLNYDNPLVVEEMLGIMRFWLDLGVDALRLDAIPYLFEREGTDCENLPETHALIKRFRCVMDSGYSSRMILAEANQWPADVLPYFGDGDECHMAFHFPLMPRIYMALRQEDRLAITDIMAQTPAIPETCQWGLFLRNHDELTLEMVTNDERDYMYLAYSADSRMRLNLGIRRRLAPLLDNNRRRIELLNSLLFSFPGTPILYYGDEIGMGDNIYLGDRNGVRTPMQWNTDRNAGFSRANPAKLYSPVIMDPLWGYEATNVEAQQGDPSSLLNWMRNMIALRKLFQVFGRGTLEFRNPANRKVLAYLRRYDDEQILCVANLSRFAQPVDLDLAALEGATPVEMLGYVQFPRIERQPYRLTLGPYGFLWLELRPKSEPVGASSEAEQPALVGDTWEGVLEDFGRSQLELLLVEYLSKQRWFGGKLRPIRGARIADWGELTPAAAALVLIEVDYETGPSDSYLLFLAASYGPEADRLRQEFPAAVISPLLSNRGRGVLHEATFSDPACISLLSLIESAGEVRTRRGLIRGCAGTLLPGLRGAPEPPLLPVRASREQSNASIIYGDRLFLKLFRRQQPGPNPEREVERYLTEKTGFDGIPPFAGSIEYQSPGKDTFDLALLEGLAENEGDLWTLTLEELERYYENCALVPLPEDIDSLAARDVVALSEEPPSLLAHDHLGLSLESAACLGRRTAELHLALASPTDDPAFAPEPLTAAGIQSLFGNLRENAARVFDELRNNVARLPDEILDLAGLVLGRRKQILDSFRFNGNGDFQAVRTRIHGDYHLAQVLRARSDYVILDFEGDPARPLAERRDKESPLKDVAGMLRSLAYAAYVSLIDYTARRPDDFEKLEPWAHLWERSTSAAFLRAYREAAPGAAFLPARTDDLRAILTVYVLDKALYELSYELNNRPDRARIPLIGILSLPIATGGREWNSMPSRNPH